RKLSRSFKTSTKDLRNALSWLIENGVTDVFFESTGQYWIPVHNIFSDADINLVLANPQYIKNVPCRKTDIKDLEWIAQLGCCGLIVPSYISTEEVMKLRLLTRRKKSYKEKSTQCKNEIHNILQRANIKLTSIVSDIFGKSGRKLLELFINGEVIEVKSVSKCMYGKMRATPHEVVEALDGKLSTYDAWLLRESLDELKFYEKKSKEFRKKLITILKNTSKRWMKCFKVFLVSVKKLVWLF
ncbi:IS110 family transposase, partial [Macrococcus capreoli]|uniref:IS110 family transposase n=1 Tax=Macrococcus capreoli TaxID=2982690 RepID=UPI003EE6E879